MHGEAPKFWVRYDDEWDEIGGSGEEAATNLACILN